MTFKVEVSSGAKRDVADAFNWYKERSAKAATSFRAEVLAAIDLVAENPDNWPLWDEGIRRFVIKRYPYSLYFEIDGTLVRILAVGHHRRQPNYWASR